MGSRDSSLTRVVPVFDRLYDADASGAAWLDALIALGSRSDAVAAVPPGQRLVPGHGRRWGTAEVELPAPLTLLTDLVSNLTPELVASSRDTGDTLERRTRLASHDQATIDEALSLLKAGKPGRRGAVGLAEDRASILAVASS